MGKRSLLGLSGDRCFPGYYSKIRSDALARTFSYMNLIEHWGSGIPRIIRKIREAGLREMEFLGGDVDLRINVYRNQINAIGVKGGVNGIKNDVNKDEQRLLEAVSHIPSATQAQYAEALGVSKRTISRMFNSLQKQGVLKKMGNNRKPQWIIIQK